MTRLLLGLALLGACTRLASLEGKRCRLPQIDCGPGLSCVEGICRKPIEVPPPRPCADDADCVDPGWSVCSPEEPRLCVQCLEDRHCQRPGGVEGHCLPNHQCVQCYVDEHCKEGRCVSFTCI